jgi:hypothetical protein
LDVDRAEAEVDDNLAWTSNSGGQAFHWGPVNRDDLINQLKQIKKTPFKRNRHSEVDWKSHLFKVLPFSALGSSLMMGM